MAPNRSSQPSKVFIDSSVLIAAAISSKGAARQLLLQSLSGLLNLCLSDLVLEETERNIAHKAPAALPAFRVFRETLAAEIVNPPSALVQQVAKTIESKDAPIVAAAITASAKYLATYDRKHLLDVRDAIAEQFQLAVATPDQILETVELATN